MWAEGKVRIVDIAQELGVSTATVSNVIHGKTAKISARTVKTYVSELNSSYHGIISSSRKGYHIDPEIGAKALKEAKSCIPQTARERVAYIMKRSSRGPV